MSRWLAIFVAVGFFGATGGVEADGLHRCLAGCGSAPVNDGVGGGDWSTGYSVDFAFAATPPKAIGQPTSPPSPAIPTPTSARPITPTPAPPRLHVLLLVDDANKDAGPANKAGAALLERTIRAGLPEDKLGTIETMSGAALTADRIKARIMALGVRSQDTVIGFYSGAMEYDEATRSYTLTPTGGGRIHRGDLKDWFLNRRAALTVLLTDAPAFRVVPEMLPPLQQQSGPFSLEGLVFRNRGSVDLHAATSSETAFPRDGEGGLFTLALVNHLRGLKPDEDGSSWPILVERVRTATDQMYAEYRKAVLTSDKVSAEDKRIYREQTHQTPAALAPLDRVKPVAPPQEMKTTNNQQSAEIVVRVPIGAKIFVEDRPTNSTGAERHFETATLQPDRTYTYSLRAELTRDGRVLSQTKKVTVKAGEKLDVQFEW